MWVTRLRQFQKCFMGADKGADAGEAGYMDRLIDVVLSLLAYASAELPSAPLREATEALFRAFAPKLTQTGACLKPFLGPKERQLSPSPSVEIAAAAVDQASVDWKFMDHRLPPSVGSCLLALFLVSKLGVVNMRWPSEEVSILSVCWVLFKGFSKTTKQMMWCFRLCVVTGLQDLIRVISRTDKAPKDEEEEVFDDEADEAQDEGSESEESDEGLDSDEEMEDALGPQAASDEELERLSGMEVDNGEPSTSDRVNISQEAFQKPIQRPRVGEVWDVRQLKRLVIA